MSRISGTGTTFRRRALAVVGVALGLGAGPIGADPADRVALEAEEHLFDAPRTLERAFANRYDCDTTAQIELIMRDGRGGERRRLFDTVSKRIDGRLRSIGRLLEPVHLRGMTIMTIEVPGQSEETFVYLPSMRKVRRISSAQRADSFLGSDITYEDFERRRVADFEIESVREEEVTGEPALRIRARPVRPQSYEFVDFVVARSDQAILATDYFKRGASEPFRTLEAPRPDMVRAAGHVLPTRLLARNALRGTMTEIVITDLQVNPEIDDRLFSVGTLEQQRALE